VAKPIVDGLEQDLAGNADVVRLNALSSIGQQAAGHFGVRGLPTLILVDGSGQEVLRQMGIIRPAPVREQVELLLAP
jgi:thioredoxin-like negative regulator of GroEL